MKTTLISLALPLFFSATNVVAHGLVTSLTVDGKVFKGNPLNNEQFPSVIRDVKTNSPVKGANNKDMTCGPSAKPAKLVADAKAGSQLAFDWQSGGTGAGRFWPHNTGPMLTYMASCGSTTCDKFDASKAKWFKIDQVGLKSNGKSWVQEDLMKGAPAKVTIPKNLKAGNYLIRHEIIGLHLAEKQGGAEFYPSCAQLRVTGSGTGVPSANELVSFPGAYSDNDAGIKVNAFDLKGSYKFPGPAVAKLAAKKETSSPDEASAPAASSTPAAAGSTKKPCNTKRSNVTRQPRRVSRVMRAVDPALLQ